jgi:hypothetical protein
MIRTDEGIQIDFSDEQKENARSPRVETRERGSNAMIVKL